MATLDVTAVLTKIQAAATRAAQNNLGGVAQKDCAKAYKIVESIAPRASFWGSTGTDVVGRLLDRVGAIADLITTVDQTKTPDLNLAAMALSDAVITDDLLQVVPDPELRRQLRLKFAINTTFDLTQFAGGSGIGLAPGATTGNILSAEGIQYATGTPALTIRTFPSLVYVPNLSGLKKLTAVNFSGTGIPAINGIQALTSLITLSLFDCTNLVITERLDDLALMQNFQVYNTKTASIGSVASWTALRQFKIFNSQFSQTELETIIGALWTNRVAIGGFACVIDLTLNPGSAGAAASQASKLTDLRTAGCTVTI
jgi:hypothetical protein